MPYWLPPLRNTFVSFLLSVSSAINGFLQLFLKILAGSKTKFNVENWDFRFNMPKLILLPCVCEAMLAKLSH